jgi:hypothetical protein
MDRAKVLVAVGSVVLIAGLLMPAVFVNETRECVEYNLPDEPGPGCEEYVGERDVSANPLRLPTILAGFVVGTVGASLWGLDLREE